MNTKLPHKLRRSVTQGLFLILSVTVAAAYGLTPEEQGFQIAAVSDRSDRGFSDSRVDLKMILRNAAGHETTRTLAITTLEIPDENQGDKSLIVFRSPPDIDGTALLSHARILDPDDQWLFLPAIKRTKRISSVSKSGPFVGSEFAFEDLTSLELNKYDYKYLRSEACGELLCDVIERYPRYEHSGYSKQVIWVDQEDHQIRQTEFYDRRGDLLKTLVLDDYRNYPGDIWRPHHYNMVNHQTGKTTELVYSDFDFQNGLSDRNFIKNVLKRQR